MTVLLGTGSSKCAIFREVTSQHPQCSSVSTMRLSEDVEYISLHKPLPFVLQGYVWPFVLLYAALLGVWIGVYGFLEYTEAFLIGFAIIAGLNIVTCLFGVWSVHVKCALTCSKASSIRDALLVKVVPTPNNGFTELVKLVKQKDKVTNKQLIWFMFQKTKYLYNEEEGRFQPLTFHTSETYSFYRDCRGYTTDMKAEAAKQLYGKNKLDVQSPDFWSLFKERATAPFFVFQVFCVGLWCLDEYWYYSLFTLAMLVSFEAILVKQQQRNLSEIRKMGTKAFKIQVFRDRKWVRLSSDELLPGDIVSVCRSKDDDVVPCDILLLYGQCIVDEALLTGESVPQMKEPLNFSLSNQALSQERLNLERDARLHMISGGTRIVQHTPPEKTCSCRTARDSCTCISVPKDKGCVGYVLRTGFNTNQGKLLRTILFGVKRVTANNFETFIFIMFLLVFAIMAAAYVWIKGTEDPERNRYKLFLECTLILTSVVPPELPIELSLAVNTSLIALAKLGIYCTEPFRIPFGGKVDVCCFDKTGTLTSDNLVVQGIAGLPKPQDKNSAHQSTPHRSGPRSNKSSHHSIPSSTPSRSTSSISVTVAKDSSFETQCVLASCHSLTYLDNDIVGDPLEKVSLKAIDWILTAKDTLSPPQSFRKNIMLKIIRRFHFTSALKRMSAVCSVGSPAGSCPAYLATVKGAPEVLRDMLTTVPDDYDATYSKLMRQGARVLALGYKHLGSDVTHGMINDMKRSHIERGLTFAGFLVIICPLKNDSKQNIRCLHDSSHHVIMLTGDNPLTACHVAKELKIAQRKLLILSHVTSSEDDDVTDDVMPSEKWEWQSIGGASKATLETDPAELGKDHDLCLTGDGLTYLLTRGPGAQAFFSRLLPFIKVFARVSPKQKELAVTTYKSLGYNTLMCGDGTNDVGALKHAHVGVALLSTIKSKKKHAAEEDEGTPVDAAEKEKGREGKGSTPLVPKTQALKRKELHPVLSAQQIREKKLKELLKQMDETEPQLVRLGDASIASPFTSRKPSISCICHVIKQGRCTLVTTLQMFKILALNALILAYSQSVLYLDGIKFSDLQATIQGFLLAGCFLFISRSKPLTSLSKERPLPNIFNLYTISTVMLQFFVHFFCLVFLVSKTKAIVGHSEEDIDLEKEFEQNELNSAVYLISMAMQISNFAVNYKGHPFMETLTENKPLLYSILGSAGALFILASGIVPELSASLQIETFNEGFRHTLIIVLLVDFAMAYAVDRFLSHFLGTAKLRLPA